MRLLLSTSLLVAAAFAATAAAERKPNILLLFTDDVNAGGFGFTGGTYGPTPNIDRLASEGLVFKSAYVTASICCPSRAGLLTGRYQQRFGHEVNAGQQTPEEGLPVTERTIADRLRPLGYRSALIGKWHQGHGIRFPHFHPERRGFDESFSFMGSMVHFFRSDALWDGWKPIREDRYLTDVIAERTAEFVTRNRNHPWFAYASFNFIHTPLQAPKEDLQAVPAGIEGDARMKWAMTRAMDRAIGTILASLVESGQDARTLIILTNDNGDYVDNLQFRGGKGHVTEGGIRVPFVVRWKDKLEAGVNDTDLVSTLDILPTAVVAGGGKIDPAWKLDGRDLGPLLRREPGATGHETLYWRALQSRALREGPWKITYEGHSSFGKSSGPSQWRLFNLESDPGEAADLTSKNPDIAKRLIAKWEAWNEQLIPPRWSFKPSGEMGQFPEQ